MEALVRAAPEATRFEKLTKKGTPDPKAASTQFPEFRAWHTLLKEIFDIEPPEWKPPEADRGLYGQTIGGPDDLDEEVEDTDDASGAEE